MNQLNSHGYYVQRAAMSHNLAQRGADPTIAAIHADLALRYDTPAAQPEVRTDVAMRDVQAA